MRASHGDREQAIEALKAAFVHGRLDKDEFDLRVGRALASRTYADLTAVTADIPAWLPKAWLPKARLPTARLPTARLPTARLPKARQPASKKKKAAAALACASLALLSGVVAVPPLPDGSPAEMSVIAVIFVLSGIVGIGWFLLLHAWLEQRAGRQSTPGLPPGDGGGASRRLAQANPAGKVPQADRDPGQAAEASPIHRLRPALPGWRAPGRQYAIS